MATTLSRAALIALLLAALPMLAREAAAQRSGTVQASAVVLGQVQSYALRADTARAEPRPDVRLLPIPGIGRLVVQADPGSVTRIVAREARLVRVTIDFVAN